MADRALVLCGGKLVRDVAIGHKDDRHKVSAELEAWMLDNG